MKRRSLENLQSIPRQIEEHHCFVSHRKSLVAPIHRLPSELLSEIFVTCIADSDFIRPSSAPRLWALGQVCCHWRDVVLTTPRLWNRLPRISAKPFFETNPYRLQTYFTLAKGLPLSVDLRIDASCVTSTPVLNSVVSHSDRIGELEIHCRWDALRLLSGAYTCLHNLHALKLVTVNHSEDADIAIFSIAPQLRGVCFMSSIRLHGNQFSKLSLPWIQLKSVTINRPDLDYAWMVFSRALHMETCTFIQIENIGNPRGTVRHTALKELSCQKGLLDKNSTLPAALSDTLVLPNLFSLLIKVDKLTINSIVSLITRSGCRLTRLVLNAPLIWGSLMTLLEETASLVHLEVYTLSPADIKGLTVGKKNGKQPVTPCLRVIHVTNSNGIANLSSINTLILSRVNPNIPQLEPIQSIRVDFDDPSSANAIYGQLRGLPWIPSTWSEYEWIFEQWAQSFRDVITRLPPKNEDITLLHSILDEMKDYKTIIQPYLATSEMYESLVCISSFDGDHLDLPKGWSRLRKRVRLLLNSWKRLKEEYGKLPQGNWKLMGLTSMSYIAPK